MNKNASKKRIVTRNATLLTILGLGPTIWLTLRWE